MLVRSGARQEGLAAMQRALTRRVPGGARKWRLIQRAGAMEPLGGVWVQRAGLTLETAAALLRHTTLHGSLPEPLRVAHLLAGALVRGESHGGAVKPGAVRVDTGRLYVAAADAWIELVEVQLAGKRAMRADELLRGLRIPPGEEARTP